MSEDNRLQKMQEYILLADRLQDRIDDPDTRHTVGEIGNILKEAIAFETRAEKSMQEHQKRKEEFYKKFDTREEAEDYIRKNSNNRIPGYAPYINSIAANAYGFAACIAACFSREASKVFLMKKDIYNKISKNKTEIIKLNKEIKQKADATIKKMSENEFAEARLLDDIKQNDKFIIAEDAEYDLIKQPELLVYAILDSIKQEHAPEL